MGKIKKNQMKKKPTILITIMTFIILLGCYSTQLLAQNTTTKTTNWEYYQGTKQSIMDYYKNNVTKLDPIEGLFSITIKIYNADGTLNKSIDNWSSVAIVRDNKSLTREFVEVNLLTGEFPKYAITAEYTKATNGVVYISKQFSADGKYSNYNCIWDDNVSLMTYSHARNFKGKDYTYKFIYIKTYPKKSLDSDTLKRKSSGTGFAISSNGYIATCNHVIDSASKITIKGIKGDFVKSYNAKVICTDTKNDLAIIKIDDVTDSILGKIPYIISSTTSDVGSSIFIMGYPLTATMGDEIKLTDGVISAKSGYRGDITSYQISAAAQPGNSGGPMFDSNGNLIGILNAKLLIGENVSYAIKSTYLTNLFDLLPSKSFLSSVNLLKGKQLTEQVKLIKNFIYIIEVN